MNSIGGFLFNSESSDSSHLDEGCGCLPTTLQINPLRSSGLGDPRSLRDHVSSNFPSFSGRLSGFVSKFFSWRDEEKPASQSTRVAKCASEKVAKAEAVVLAQDVIPFDFQEFQKNPHQYATTPDFQAEFPFIKECSCHHVSQELRASVEVATLKNVETNIKDKTALFTILSIGPGQCLQELVYIQKLAALGHEKIHLIALDPSEDTSRSLENISKFMKANLPEVEFSYERPTTSPGADLLMTYNPSEHPSPQLVLMIDLDATDPQYGPLSMLEKRSLHVLQSKWRFQNYVLSYAFHRNRSPLIFAGQSLYVNSPDILTITDKRFKMPAKTNIGFDGKGQPINVIGDCITWGKANLTPPSL